MPKDVPKKSGTLAVTSTSFTLQDLGVTLVSLVHDEFAVARPIQIARSLQGLFAEGHVGDLLKPLFEGRQEFGGWGERFVGAEVVGGRRPVLVDEFEVGGTPDDAVCIEPALPEIGGEAQVVLGGLGRGIRIDGVVQGVVEAREGCLSGGLLLKRAEQQRRAYPAPTPSATSRSPSPLSSSAQVACSLPKLPLRLTLPQRSLDTIL